MELVKFSTYSLHYEFRLNFPNISKASGNRNLEQLAGAVLLKHTILARPKWEFTLKCGPLQYRFPRAVLRIQSHKLRERFETHKDETSYDLDAKFAPCMNILRRLLYVQFCSLNVLEEDPDLFAELLTVLDVRAHERACFKWSYGVHFNKPAKRGKRKSEAK